MILFWMAIVIIALGMGLLVYGFALNSPEILGISECCTIASLIFSASAAFTGSKYFSVLPIATVFYVLLHISDVQMHISALLSDAKEKKNSEVRK